MASINKIMAEIRSQKPRSAWGNGVKKYALELLEDVKEWKGGAFNLTQANYQSFILNGASNWKEYSWGGSSLIHDEDIAKRLSTKTELALTQNGQRRPNAREEWLDTQARALHQASMLIREAIVSATISAEAQAKKKVMRKAPAKRTVKRRA